MDEAEDLLNQHLLTNKPESGSDFGALNGGTTLFCRKTGVSRTFVAGEIVDNTIACLSLSGTAVWVLSLAVITSFCQLCHQDTVW
jgi:hypothetical protein